MHCSVLTSLLVVASALLCQAAPCSNPQTCPATYEPLCAKNGGSFVNRCQLDAANCKNATAGAVLAYPGECKTKLTTRNSILLVGDSITRRSFDPALMGWGVRLAYDYSPYLDVLNRGMGGYTTKWMLEFGMTDLRASLRKFQPSIVTLWLGTNDALSVSLTQFRVYYLELLKNIQAFAPTAKVLLIAPPPVKDDAQSAGIRDRGTIVKDIATTKKLDFVDLYDVFMTGYPTPEARAALWVDGIHLTAVGNNEAYKAIKAKLSTMMPDVFFKTLQEPLVETLNLIA